MQQVRPLNQVLSSIADQELGLHIENDVTSSDDLQKVYTIDEFEVRIMELEKPSGRWETKSSILMQSFENALTVRIVTLQVCLSCTLVWMLHSNSNFIYHNIIDFHLRTHLQRKMIP